MNIYKDTLVEIQTPKEVATKGHIIITSDKTNISQINEDDFAQVFSAASFASTVLFEQAGAHGTNIFIDDLNNVEANILARIEGDNISFQWKPKEYAQGEIDSYCAKIKDKCDYIGQTEDRKKNQESGKESENNEEKNNDSVERNSEKRSTLGVQEDKNYLIEQLNRIP